MITYDVEVVLTPKGDAGALPTALIKQTENDLKLGIEEAILNSKLEQVSPCVERVDVKLHARESLYLGGGV